jgi:hypothetical protein
MEGAIGVCMRAAQSQHEAAPPTASLMGGEIGVCVRAAPSQHEAAPTTASLMEGASIRVSVRWRQPWETKRRRELASGNASGEGGGAVTNHPPAALS